MNRTHKEELMDSMYLAVGPHVWGRAPDADEAVQNAKDAGIPWGYFDGDAEIQLYRVPEGTWVTDIGTFRNEDCTQEEWDEIYEEIETRKVKRPSGR